MNRLAAYLIIWILLPIGFYLTNYGSYGYGNLIGIVLTLGCFITSIICNKKFFGEAGDENTWTYSSYFSFAVFLYCLLIGLLS